MTNPLFLRQIKIIQLTRCTVPFSILLGFASLLGLTLLDESLINNLLFILSVMVCFIRTHPTISNHLRLRPPTLRCHSDAHCISSHNHATSVTGLNSDQCLISLDLVPMSQAATYLSFSPYAAFA